MNRNGIICEVYRARGFEGCALGGISETADRVLLVGEGVEGPTTENEATASGVPVVELDRRKIGGEIYLTARPVGMPHGMMGGTFIETSDSRFPGRYPIPLHDRMEDASAINRHEENNAAELKRLPGRIAGMIRWEIGAAREFAGKLLEQVNDHGEAARMFKRANDED